MSCLSYSATSNYSTLVKLALAQWLALVTQILNNFIIKELFKIYKWFKIVISYLLSFNPNKSSLQTSNMVNYGFILTKFELVIVGTGERCTKMVLVSFM